MANLAEFHPSWMTRMKDGLLGKLDCNVILVSWPKGSLPPYAQATGNTRLVGAMIGELIKFLISQTQGSADLFHVVGFSLGGQIAGYTGSHLRKAGLTLGRITGLDPAGPLFASTPPAVRLDPSDATFVDVIHTDAKRWGIEQSCGHIDFYPNGGVDQVGCLDVTTGWGPLNPVVCDHFRATDYFIDSLSPNCTHAMEGFPCSNADDFDRGRCLKCNGTCPIMGYKAVKSKNHQIHGSHYLYTAKSSPFCVRYYTTITFDTIWSVMSSLLKAHIVIILYGDGGETESIQLKSRNLKKKSTETFVVPTSLNIGKLIKIKVRQTFSSWILQWRLQKVTVSPGWTGAQSGRSTQIFSACFNCYVGFTGVVKNLSSGDVSC
ncbi:hypothetical protein ABFA07_013584 [Porites harrisoni]